MLLVVHKRLVGVSFLSRVQCEGKFDNEKLSSRRRFVWLVTNPEVDTDSHVKSLRPDLHLGVPEVGTKG